MAERLFEEPAIPTSTPYAVPCSQSTLHIAGNPVFREITKHIEVERNKLHDSLVMTVHHVTTSEQLADTLTKALTGVKHSWQVGYKKYTSNFCVCVGGGEGGC